MQEKFQVVVIGGGPGGYVAAIRASQLGFSVAVVEKESMGGVCLNWGCIPTKALLQSAHLLQEIEKASTFGIVAEKPKPDFPAIIQRSRGVADQMSKGVTFLMKKNKVTVFSGEATFTDPHTIRINGKDKIQADYFIIATGARAREFPGVPFDKEIILSSREAMVEKQIPGRLAIIGAGAIGVEFADFYASMGSDVTIIEYLPHVLPNEDSEVCVALERSFKKRNITMKLSSSVTKIETKNSKAFLSIKPNSGKEDEETLEFDKVIVGIGLSPNTVGIGLEEVGVKLDSKGFIETNAQYATTVESIYAIGDCIGAPLLAHVASLEGIKAAEAIAIHDKKEKLHYEPINYDLVPGCTYCHPEVASFGMTEEKAKAAGVKFKIGRFPFSASGRAQALGDASGFIKVIAEEEHGEILGAHIIGTNASEIISELVIAANTELTIHNIAQIIHAHPTLSEGMMEACADVLGEAINI